VFAATGTINTSDRREKRDVADVPVQLALAFLAGLNGKVYKWKDDKRNAVVNSVPKQRQMSVKVTRTVQRERIEITGGVARIIMEPHEFIEETLLWDEYPVVDDNGNPVYESAGRGKSQQRIHRVPRMETYYEDVEVTKAVDKKNIRTHSGFIAQDVEKVLLDSGFTTQDFAGLVIDQETGRYGLRYDQFIPLLWTAVQELARRQGVI